ncbi:hypothetical protein EJB05_40591, partial [Eragrostis curvula]
MEATRSWASSSYLPPAAISSKIKILCVRSVFFSIYRGDELLATYVPKGLSSPNNMGKLVWRVLGIQAAQLDLTPLLPVSARSIPRSRLHKLELIQVNGNLLAIELFQSGIVPYYLTKRKTAYYQVFQLHEAPEVCYLGWMHRGVGRDVSEGGGTAPAVHGIRDAKVHGALERHGLHVTEDMAMELGKSDE